MFPKPVGKAAIIANDFAFNSQMELEVCNQLFCLLPPAKRQRNGGEDGYDQSSSESTMTRSVCIFFHSRDERDVCRFTPNNTEACVHVSRQQGSRRKKKENKSRFHQTLGFSFSFFSSCLHAKCFTCIT